MPSPSPSPAPPPSQSQLLVPAQTRAEVVAKIEALIQALLTDLSTNTPLSLPTSKLTPAGLPTPPPRSAHASFPGKPSRPDAATRFTALLAVLAHMHRCAATGQAMTKRDLFYQEPGLFGTQAAADRLVEVAAVALGARREELGIVAAAKGLVAGDVAVWAAEPEPPDEHGASGRWRLLLRATGAPSESALVPHIPPSAQQLRWDLRAVHWVLVVEKEATFRHLSGRGFAGSEARGGLLVTAKGYPDVDTRAFLNRLAAAEPCVPVHILADWDPDGLGIAATYARGSKALAGRRAELAVPGAGWIGVRAKDVLGVVMGGGSGEVLSMSERDRRVARGMLLADLRGGGEWGARREWREELRVMLMLSVKAEIQVLDGAEGGLCAWLRRRMGL